MRTAQQISNLREWVAALRSGLYKQGTSWLARANKFCCLGIAAELSNCPFEYGETTGGDTFKRFQFHGDGGFTGADSSMPSSTFMDDRFGMTYADASLLAKMNDSGSTFNEIADYIELNYIKGV